MVLIGITSTNCKANWSLGSTNRFQRLCKKLFHRLVRLLLKVMDDDEHDLLRDGPAQSMKS
jgi:hypothetical protein